MAFFSLSPAQLEQCRDSNTPSEKRISRLLRDPRMLLATILIINNLVNVAIVTISTYIMWSIAGRDNELALGILTLLTTAAIIFFGEILPKVLANTRNLALARNLSGLILFVSAMAYPFAWVLVRVGRLIERNFARKQYEVSVLELNEAVELTTRHSTTTDEGKEILKGIVNFGTKTVRQIMRSRIDITAVDYEEPYPELLETVLQSGYSRIPVYHDTIDQIKGILYIKDLLPHINEAEDFRWQNVVHSDVFFVHEGKKIDELLRDFQQKRVHMAIVADEYGGTTGLITMEDIIEEIVGDITDEFDSNENFYRKLDHNRYTFEGKTSLNDFCRVLDIPADYLAEAKGESESVAGLMLELFSKMPATGEQISWRGLSFTIAAVDQKRIKQVRVLLKESVEK